MTLSYGIALHQITSYGITSYRMTSCGILCSSGLIEELKECR